LDLAWYGGAREQATRELLLATLMAAQAAQIQDLRERVASCYSPVAVRLKVPQPLEMGGLNRIAEDYLRRVLGLGRKERHC
jgi:hypothetical protein